MLLHPREHHAQRKGQRTDKSSIAREDIIPHPPTLHSEGTRAPQERDGELPDTDWYPSCSLPTAEVALRRHHGGPMRNIKREGGNAKPRWFRSAWNKNPTQATQVGQVIRRRHIRSFRSPSKPDNAHTRVRTRAHRKKATSNHRHKHKHTHTHTHTTSTRECGHIAKREGE